MIATRYQFDVAITEALLYQDLSKLGSCMMGSAVTVRDCERELLPLKGELLSMN